MPTEVHVTTIFSIVKDATLTGCLLYALWSSSRKGWRWNYQFDEQQAMYERLLREEQSRTKYWQDFAMNLLGPLEIVARKLPKNDGVV